MKCAAVTGAGGFIGGHLSTALVARDCQVRRIKRTELSTPDLQGVDTLFHLAGLAHAGAQGADRREMFSVNAEQTLALFRKAGEAGVDRFVWLSSIKVLGDVSEHPLTVAAPYQPGDVYAESKAEAERLLLEEASTITRNGTQLSIVRPPLVYGRGVGANFYAMLSAADSSWPLPLKSAQAPRAWLGVDNLVDMLVLLADTNARSKSIESNEAKIWHVRDLEESNVRQMISLCRELMSRSAHLWSVSPRIAMMAGALLGRRDMVSRLFQPLRVDMSDTQRQLGWQPPNPQLQQLKQVVAWYQTH